MARCSQDVTGVCMSVLCLDFMLSVGPFSRLYESCVFFGVGFCGVWSWAGFADTVSPGRQFHEVAGYVIPAPPPSFPPACQGSRGVKGRASTPALFRCLNVHLLTLSAAAAPPASSSGPACFGPPLHGAHRHGGRAPRRGGRKGEAKGKSVLQQRILPPPPLLTRLVLSDVTPPRQVEEAGRGRCVPRRSAFLPLASLVPKCLMNALNEIKLAIRPNSHAIVFIQRNERVMDRAGIRVALPVIF